MGSCAMRFAGAIATTLVAWLPLSALAQQDRVSAFEAPHGVALAGTRTYLGFTVGRSLETNCPAAVLVCENRERPAQLYAGTMFGRNWGAELGFVDSGRLVRTIGESRAQGLALSLVGRTQLFGSLGVYGKVGTTFGRSDTAVMGNAPASGAEQGFGIAYGGGLSYDFTKRLSATFEVDSFDLRFANGPPVRSAKLGLQYRY